jgi:hypothetical protein
VKSVAEVLGFPVNNGRAEFLLAAQQAAFARRIGATNFILKSNLPA